jgi:hypothetical protein
LLYARSSVLTYEVIGDVSQTLQNVLEAGLQAVDSQWHAELHDLVATPAATPPKLTIFLYDVVEDASARNRPPDRKPGLPSYTIKKPPLALALRYMLTAWAGDRLTEHRIIGRAIQVLYDRAILSGSTLGGAFANSNESLKLTLAPIGLEQRAQVWQAIQKTYHLSVNYEVRVVHLDPEGELHTPTVQQALTVPSTSVR